MTAVAHEAAFRRIAREMFDISGVTEGTGFGSNPGLRYRTKIFAMLGNGGLVVKLPRERVERLLAAGTARRFDPRRDGRVMKEWATIPVASRRRWKALAEEALEFARSTAARG